MVDMSRREGIVALREAARREAAALVRGVASPREFSETIEACIQRAAHKLGWTYGRTEDIWRREARRIESFEMDALRKFNRVPRGNSRINSELAEFSKKPTSQKHR